MTREVRSPWSRAKSDPDPHGMRGYSPGSQSSPSNAARSDSGHLNRHAGKGWTPLSRRDAIPVQGAPYRDPTDPRR
jgi:hypothetical protein